MSVPMILYFPCVGIKIYTKHTLYKHFRNKSLLKIVNQLVNICIPELP